MCRNGVKEKCVDKLEVTEQAFKITLPFRPEVMNELK